MYKKMINFSDSNSYSGLFTSITPYVFIMSVNKLNELIYTVFNHLIQEPLRLISYYYIFFILLCPSTPLFEIM